MSITGKMPLSLPSPSKSNLGRPLRKETVFPARKNCDRLTSGGKRDTRQVGRGRSQDPEVVFGPHQLQRIGKKSHQKQDDQATSQFYSCAELELLFFFFFGKKKFKNELVEITSASNKQNAKMATFPESYIYQVVEENHLNLKNRWEPFSWCLESFVSSGKDLLAYESDPQNIFRGQCVMT